MHVLCLSCIQGTQYHNAVQKFIDICKLSEIDLNNVEDVHSSNGAME